MPVTTIEETKFPEKGTKTLKVSFLDENDMPAIPNASTIKWTLTDKPTDRTVTATVINSRLNQAVPSSSIVHITLQGLDLALQSGETDEPYASRVLTLEWEYNSTFGNNLPGKAQYIFDVENMYYIT